MTIFVDRPLFLALNTGRSADGASTVFLKQVGEHVMSHEYSRVQDSSINWKGLSIIAAAFAPIALFLVFKIVDAATDGKEAVVVRSPPCQAFENAGVAPGATIPLQDGGTCSIGGSGKPTYIPSQ
jgi:hypothetical protein